MKKRKFISCFCIILAVLLAFPLGTVAAEQTKPGFSDVRPTDYFYDAVLWAVENEITMGMDASTFCPSMACTRAQVVTFLWRAFGEPAPVRNENPFKDVAEAQYYYDAVLWAVENGITTGLSAETFGPNANCNRSQIVTFLWRAMNKPAPTSSENPFTDVLEGQYYYDAVLWAVEKGITTGMSAKSFAPNATCTRGQIVCFLYRAFSDHQHVYNSTVIAPTCTDDGYTLYQCTNCDYEYKYSETAALGHDFSEWFAVIPPTAEEEGLETRTCRRDGCNIYEERTIDKLPADDGGNDSGDDEGGYYWFGNIKKPWDCASQGHHVTNKDRQGKRIQDASCIHDEIWEYTCDVVGCGVTWTEIKNGPSGRHTMSDADQSEVTKGDYFYSIRCRCGRGNRGGNRDEALAVFNAHAAENLYDVPCTIVEEREGHYHKFPSSTFVCTVCGEAIAFSEVYAHCDEC